MTARTVFLVVLIVALSIGGMATSGYAWSRSDCDGRASGDYVYLVWTAGADGYYNGTKVFEEGNVYTGMAYWWGGWDTKDQFLNKMAAGKAPRQEAGTDCSGLVSRCWNLSSKRSTSTLNGISTALADQNYAEMGDILNKSGDHVVLIHNWSGRARSDKVHIYESYGAPIHKCQYVTENTWAYYLDDDYDLRRWNEWRAVTSWGGIKALFSTESGNASANLQWDPAPGANDATRYKVCYGTSSGSHPYETEEINGCAKTVSGLTPGTKYYFVTKVGSDADGWSEDSNEEWVIPYVEMQVPGDYSTIQAAVNAAPSNGAAKIYLASGYYETGAALTINKGVRIIGAGYSNTTIDDQVKFYYAPMPILTESGQIVATGIDNVSIWGHGNSAFAWFSDRVVFYRVQFWSWDYYQSYVVGLDVWDSDTSINRSLFLGNGVLFWGADPYVRYSSFKDAPDYAIQLYAGSDVDRLTDSNFFTYNAGYIYGSSSVPHIEAGEVLDNYWGTTNISYIQSKMDVYNGIDIPSNRIRSSQVLEAYPKPVLEGMERLDIASLRREQNALKTRVEVKSDSAALLLRKVVRIYQLLGEYDLAHRYLRNVKIGHADNQPLVLRARVLEVGNEIRRRRPFEALKKADALIKDHPDAPVARQMLLTKGVIYMSDPEAGNLEKAEEAFEEALATSSDELLAKNIRRYLAMVADSKDIPGEKRRRDIELSSSPNPANPSTMIRFRLGQAEQVILSIYNTLGQKINMLVNGEMTAGPHSVIWDGKDATGREVASGVYFVRLEAGGRMKAKKLLLLR